MNTFRRIDEDTIVLDGLVWNTNAEKKQKFKHTETKEFAHNAIIGESVYYPVAFDRKTKSEYKLIKEDNKTKA